MTQVTKVCSTTLYSCGLACIESILIDNGIDFSQERMLSEYANQFPAWTKEPGLIGPKDFEIIFGLAGLPVSMTLPNTFSECIQMMPQANVVGAIMATAKGWEDASKTKLIHNFHALRLVAAGQSGITVMNPYRCPSEGQIETWEWEEVKLRETQPFIFLRKQEGSD